MSESWATDQELSFLQHLGTYREGHEISPMRLQLLENYVKAARARVDWGPINGERVLQYAEEQLAQARRKAG